MKPGKADLMSPKGVLSRYINHCECWQLDGVNVVVTMPMLAIYSLFLLSYFIFQVLCHVFFFLCHSA